MSIIVHAKRTIFDLRFVRRKAESHNELRTSLSCNSQYQHSCGLGSVILESGIKMSVHSILGETTMKRQVMLDESISVS